MTRTLRNLLPILVAIGILVAVIADCAVAQNAAGLALRSVSAASPAGSFDRAAERQLLGAASNITMEPARLRTQRNRISPLNQDPLLFFLAASYDTGGTNPVSVAVADLNGDGKLDLVVDNENIPSEGSLAVLLGNGDGTFQTAVTYDSGGTSRAGSSVAIDDFNGDGRPDLAVINSASAIGSVAVLLGNGDGTFQPAILNNCCAASIGWPGAVAAADLNQDGKADLLVADASQMYSAGVLLGNGNGSFGSPLWYDTNSSGACSIAANDVNGDGKTDVIVVTWYYGRYQDYSHGTVSVFLGNGDGSLQPAISYKLAKIGYSVAVGDVNGDGRPDLAVASHWSSMEGVVEIFLGNGDGTFRSAIAYDSGGIEASSVAIADVNGDLKPDVLVANGVSGSVGTLVGNGDGTFQPAATYSSGGTYPDSVVVADVNGDGKMDVIAANNSSHSLGVLLHTGTAPTTTALVSSLNPAAPHKVVTYTATVTSQDGGEVIGWVTFQDGGSTMTTVPVAHNQALYKTAYDKGGVHTMAAVYSGDTKNAGNYSDPLTQYIEIYGSKTAVATSGSPSFVGQQVTFTTAVTSKHGPIPDGELVTFYDGTKILSSVALAGGKAGYTTSSLSAKTHTIKATYAGDNLFLPSTGTVKQIVIKYATTATLASNTNPSNYGEPVTFTATVTPSGPYSPTGKVKFWDGTTSLGAAALKGGVATLTRSTLAVGTHPITAQYLSDAYNDKSTSSVVNQVVQ